MNIPVIDDWDGETWQCVEVSWPDSPLWSALLAGLLTTPSKGRLWDERTGSIKAMQGIAQQIYEMTWPWRSCETGHEIESGTNGIEPLEIGNIGELIMGCSIPYGSLKWVGGALYYKYCGEWYPVLGDGDETVEMGSGTITQPDDSEAPVVPEEYSTATSCSKARAITSVLHTVVDILFDQINQGVIVPTTIANEVKKTYPSIAFGAAELLNAIISAGNLALLGVQDESENESWIIRLDCAIALVITPGNQGLTQDELFAVQKAIEGAVDAEWPFLLNPVSNGNWWNLYRSVYRSLGTQDTINLTSYAYDDGVDCGCPDYGTPVGEYAGWFRFYDVVGLDTSMFVIKDNGLTIEFDVPFPGSTERYYVTPKWTQSGQLTQWKAEYTPIGAYVPASHQTFIEVHDPIDTWWRIAWGSGWVVSAVYEAADGGKLTVTHVSEGLTPPTPAQMSMARVPWSTADGHHAFKVTITEINGVAVP